MIKDKYIPLLKEKLSNEHIDLVYDSRSKRNFIAELIYFLLLSGLSFCLFYRKFFVLNEPTEQMAWDVFLASILLIWSFLILLRALFLKPSEGNGISLNQYGISVSSSPDKLISWDDLSGVTPLPWVVFFNSKKGYKLKVGFFLQNFSKVSKLFSLLVLPVPESKVKCFDREVEIKSLLESLVHSSPRP